MTNNPSQSGAPDLPNNQPPRGPLQVLAAKVGEIVRCGLVITFWFLVSAAGVAVAYVCLRCLIWAVRLIQSALGMA